MKRNFKTLKRVVISALMLLFGGVLALPPVAWAEGEETASGPVSGFSMSPMYEKIVLNPGDSYTSSFMIVTSSNATSDFHYKVYVQSYYRDDNNNAIFEDVDGRGQMANWITIDSPTEGVLKPNEGTKIYFTIDVPENAPAGGQYAAVTVGSATGESVGGENSVSIQESVAMGYTVYAEITGNTKHQGEIKDANVPSFLLSGKITGSSSVKNTGNVHGDAIYKMQVFPLFSDEEIYTNEENPETHLILPNRTLYNETVWEETPSVGIFNVIYTVEFEGVTTEVSKLVIICPIWLLFIIFFVIAMIIIWIVLRVRARGKAKARKSDEEKAE